MLTVQRASILQYSFSRIESLIRQFLQSRYLIFGMTSLQLFWLAAIQWTGASSDSSKIMSLGIYSLIAASVVILLPNTIISKVRILKAGLLKNENLWLFLLVLATVSVGIFYSFNQHIWGDEQRSLRVARIVSAEGVEAAYQESGWLSKKHPPLMPVLYGLILNLPGSNILYLRLVSVLFLAATMAVTYYLGRELYDRNTGYLASFLLLLFPLTMRLGASAMMDIQLTFFFALALLMSLWLARNRSVWLAILTGLVLGLGLLTKYIMLLVYPVLIVCIIFLPDFRRQKFYFALALLVSGSVFFGWLLYANHIGILAGQIQKIMDYSGIYHLFRDVGEKVQPAVAAPETPVPGATADLIQSAILRLGLETFFTRLPSSLGVQHLPLIMFGAIFLLKRREMPDLFVLFWVGLVCTILFLTLPDHRYFLPAFPGIAILIARMFGRFSMYTERAVLLSFLFWASSLYLFLNWVREARIFY